MSSTYTNSQHIKSMYSFICKTMSLSTREQGPSPKETSVLGDKEVIGKTLVYTVMNALPDWDYGVPSTLPGV